MKIKSKDKLIYAKYNTIKSLNEQLLKLIKANEFIMGLESVNELKPNCYLELSVQFVEVDNEIEHQR